MTEWHVRDGGRGVMIYWHVDRKSLCIYSQLKTCSSSEVAAMIEGVMRHCTEMSVDRQYVDTHGQSEVAFAFCRLLVFRTAATVQGHRQAEALPPGNREAGCVSEPGRDPGAPINWELIRQQYDQMVKYATALCLGTAETEAILRRFTRNNLRHPTYKVLAEVGKAVKTIFLCRYLQFIELRREIQEGLNVVENWNSAERVHLIRQGQRDGEQPPQGHGTQHACAAPIADMPGLCQYPDDPSKSSPSDHGRSA